MRHRSLTVIQEEHQALAAMLRSMLLLVSQARRDHTAPNFGVLRAMLFYVDEFPERLHHPKETELLFPKVRAACPELAATLDKLDRDHTHGEAAVRTLAHALAAWEMLGEPRRAAFEQALDAYVGAYLHHMGVEESEILPAARQHLSDADWAVLDAAFDENRDPLAGHAGHTGHAGQAPGGPADDEYAPLFQRILREAPAPIGLG